MTTVLNYYETPVAVTNEVMAEVEETIHDEPTLSLLQELIEGAIESSVTRGRSGLPSDEVTVAAKGYNVTVRKGEHICINHGIVGIV